MKKIVLTVGIFFLFFASFSQQDMLLEGNYWGKNIYIFNPFVDGVSSISKISVNNHVLDSVFTSNSYVVDLTKMNFSIGQSIIISIQHLNNYEPVVTNPEAIAPTKDFNIESFKYNKKDNNLNWNVKELEKGKIYDIEQFIWGKWLKVHTVGLTDTVSTSCYTPIYNSGLNLFRLKQYETKSKNSSYTKSIKIRPGTKEVFIVNVKASKVLEFTDLTRFEIIDTKGKIVISGKGKEINIETLSPGDYFVNYDNKTEGFIKK